MNKILLLFFILYSLIILVISVLIHVTMLRQLRLSNINLDMKQNNNLM